VTVETQDLAVPMYYHDGKVIHICESGIHLIDAIVVWTKCDQRVPPEECFTIEYGRINVTCPKCRSAAIPLTPTI